MRIRVVRLATGLWRAVIEGEEDAPEVDADPDHALLILIRRNLHRFGIEAISYECALAPSAGDAPRRRRKGRGQARVGSTGHALAPQWRRPRGGTRSPDRLIQFRGKGPR